MNVKALADEVYINALSVVDEEIFEIVVHVTALADDEKKYLNALSNVHEEMFEPCLHVAALANDEIVYLLQARSPLWGLEVIPVAHEIYCSFVMVIPTLVHRHVLRVPHVSSWKSASRAKMALSASRSREAADECLSCVIRGIKICQ